MKLSESEQRAVDDAAIWYVDGLRSLAREAHRNAAFAAATDKAIEGLNGHLHRRLALAFSGVMVKDPTRYREVMSWSSRVISDAVDQAVGNRLTAKPATKPGDDTLRNYLNTLESLLHVARDEEGSIRSLDGAPIDKGKEFARRLWATMRNARIFDFPSSDFASIWQSADHYTTTKIAKMDWVELGKGPTPDESESQRFTESIDEAGARVPFPDPLPFDACYFGLGNGVPLAEYQWRARTQDTEPRDVVGAAILGYVIWTGPGGGWVVEMIQVVEPEDNYMLPNVVCMNGIWHRPVMNLAPWIATHLVAVVNDHRQLVVETRMTSNQRHDWGKKGKKLRVQGLIPKPYYTVRMEKKLIDDSGKRSREKLAKISRELAYRHDRRGHERCYIRRGKLPLDPKDAQKLQEAEYQIWTLDEPSSNAYRQLMERGQPPKAPDEWIAILTRWIDPTVVGDEAKPYIPAIRIPTASSGSTASPGAPPEA